MELFFSDFDCSNIKVCFAWLWPKDAGAVDYPFNVFTLVMS